MVSGFLAARSATCSSSNGVVAVSGTPLNPSGFAGGDDSWTHAEGADPLRLELATRGANHVLSILQDWVGNRVGRLDWEYGWVISVEQRDREWEVVIQGLTGDERVLCLLVPEPTGKTLDLRLAVEAICSAGSAVLLFAPAGGEHPVGDQCDGTLVGVVPERVENFGRHIPLVTAGQHYGKLPRWWPVQASFPPIPVAI